MHTDARLASEIDISGFRAEAGELLAHQVPPDEVLWHTVTLTGDGLYAEAPHLVARVRGAPRSAAAIVPPSFQRLCELVVMHREPDRFALLYRLLWRLVHEPGLRHDAHDADLMRAQHMGHAVRRDIHKAKTQLRFRPLQAGPGEPLQLAWCDPVHHVVEAVAQWNAKRMADAHWALLSPQRSADWNGRRLLFGPGLAPYEVPGPDAPDAAWLAAWRKVFDGAGRPAG